MKSQSPAVGQNFRGPCVFKKDRCIGRGEGVRAGPSWPGFAVVVSGGGRCLAVTISACPPAVLGSTPPKWGR
eukprot:820569-Pyramimonas_sp.AAC.1